ncbi:Na/Pi cotransporter family protein [Natranaerofaba carboxydovora]|uniref:Na/Pi cotransporter family protein n=1 Tax=Natranaerofaba carboxydovora TaxID=2742683 RepID=UPI001F1396AE|nr:Na/Pi cotransporter family protein [Natranaerofaba carboxydovora]UMZ75123.1 Phosphate-specific transport system accessory protein PhoU [Natranaerofaba carboxydovora]
MDLFTQIITGVLGGLGLFIYGIHIMAEGMQKAAGDKLRNILEVLTINPFVAMLTGIGLTVLVQSSSTSTVMVVSFVNAGLIGLGQAVGTIFGANIGTTITAQVVSFDLGKFALPAIAVGMAFFMFSKRRVKKNIGKATLGFGILFLGMTLLSDSMAPLSEEPLFLNLLERFGEIPILGVLAGAVFTVMVQSSSAASGVIIALTLQGLLDFESGLALIMGTNIGTCATTLIAGIGANLSAKRTATAHITFNLIGTLFFLLILPVFSDLVQMTADTVPRQVANAHTIFNLGAALIFLPFTSQFARLMKKLVPGEELNIEHGSKYLDKRVLGTPTVAIANARNEVVRMAKIAGEMVEEAFDAFVTSDGKKMQSVQQKETIVDQLEKEITVYLSEISHNALTVSQSRQLTSLMNAVNDIERVGDHSENLIGLAQNRIEDNLPFTDTAIEELQEFFEKVHKMYIETVEALENNDADKAREMIEYDDVIDEMEKIMRKHHITRLNEKRCHPSSGVIYLDILSNFERIGDHSTNLCHVVLGED